tara:strand:- start:319 stop:465 length:147 start_codon:yes stop_codon:yes gene_type:complete
MEKNIHLDSYTCILNVDFPYFGDYSSSEYVIKRGFFYNLGEKNNEKNI